MLGGLTDHWLEPIRRLARAYAIDLGQLAEIESRRDRLAELNVIEGVRRIAETPPFSALGPPASQSRFTD